MEFCFAVAGVASSTSVGTAFATSTGCDPQESAAAVLASSPSYDDVTCQVPTVVGMNDSAYGPAPETVNTRDCTAEEHEVSPGANTRTVSEPDGR